MKTTPTFLTCAGLLLLAIVSAHAADMGVSVSPRVVIDWDHDWRFNKSDNAIAMMPQLDDAGWRTVRVPHDWSNEEPYSQAYGSGNGYAEGGVAWYRKHFPLAPADQGKVVTVEFDGVYEYAEVWLNGHLVGRRPYGYISFQFDLSRYLNFDGENLLAVRVDHSRPADSRYYTGSGIYRHVRLCLTDKLHVAPWGTFVTTPKIEDATARVHAATTVVNETAASRTFTLQSYVMTADGKVVASRASPGKLAAGQSMTVEQDLDVSRPSRWSLETPVLYTLRNRVVVGSAVVDETSTSFGIRTFAFHPDHGFSLNGRVVKLKGVCLHHDGGVVGAAVPEQVWESRLRRLREMGVNAIRTSHNPPAPELLDLCDRLGFLVQDEAFDEFTPSKSKWIDGWTIGVPGKHGYAELFDEWSVRDIEDLVRRDRNHPSVIMWSIGNEIDGGNDPFSDPVLGKDYRPANPPASDMVRLGTPLVAAVKRFDPTRPVTAALANVAMSDAVGFGALLDIVGYNYQEQRYPADHTKLPRRVIYGSENRHDYQAWAAVRDHDYISAQFLWTGIDYLGEAGAWPTRANAAGLLDLCGFKKPVGWFRQSLWSDAPMVYLCVPLPPQNRRPTAGEHWNWTAGSTVEVACYTNCAEVELTLNGQSLGVKPATAAVDGVLTWSVPYAPGTLKAIGRNQGREASSFALTTARAPAKVELVASADRLRANANDVCELEFRVVDAHGVRVPDAAQRVTFEITGPAELLAVGNGKLSDTDSCRDATHAAYQGHGLALVRSIDTPGSITVRASASGLEPAVVTLNSQSQP